MLNSPNTVMSVVVVINPVCGDRSAPSFFADHVFPLLRAQSIPVLETILTTHAGHAASAIAALVHPGSTLTVILGSGDGTLHEIINGLGSAGSHQLQFALVPCGTANALYASLFPPHPAGHEHDPPYRLQSVLSFITNTPAKPLSIATTTLSSSSHPPQVTVAAVVVSTSLHASILRDSESLRHQYPGIERFKIAAQLNSSKWYNGNVKLMPTSSMPVVQIYDYKSNSFIDHPDSNSNDSLVNVEGPFVYFLSTFNVDRLEPAFRITPLARANPPSSPVCEIVIVRPLRDPSIIKGTAHARTDFVSKLWKILGGVYQDGSHINMRYGEGGEIVAEGEGIAVVEYVRCGSWEWIPAEQDHGAHFVCSDGAILEIGSGGRACCKVNDLEHGVSVFG
ncbi:ATP-NAD kinase-like domain-containing protein [Crassisporium funariophilum]|nr:ATP-NAD kinase-like domain-containing protein [Crassisporium funariophilum]